MHKMPDTWFGQCTDATEDLERLSSQEAHWYMTAEWSPQECITGVVECVWCKALKACQAPSAPGHLAEVPKCAQVL